MRDKANHYYSEKPRSRYERWLISDYIRGVSVEFVVSPGVFSKSRVDPGTKILLEHAHIPDDGLVLDVGAGYGVIGIVIAKVNPKLKVYMVEINKRAIELALENIKRNNVEDRVIVLHGNLYEPVKNMKFNLVISNPPYSAGMKVVESLIRGAYDILLEGGSLQVVARKGSESVKKLMRNVFSNVEVIGRGSGYKVFKSTRQ